MSEPMGREQVASHFVRHGYALVYQDCVALRIGRGVHQISLRRSRRLDTMDWIATQSCATGASAPWVFSYAAHSAARRRLPRPPGLATMILDSAASPTPTTCGIRQGGAFELKQATWAYGQAIEPRRRPAMSAFSPRSRPSR